MSEEQERNRLPANDNSVLLVKFLAVAVLVYPVLHFTILRGELDNLYNNNTSTVAEPPVNKTIEEIPVLPPPKKIIIQPSCPLSYLRVVLQELCEDLFKCSPEDVDNLEKHKLPKLWAKNNTQGEPRGTIVGCVAAGLLLTSLGAAFLELYKAKSQTPVKQKPPMNRKCSLADLTVLKHNRKELVRRESIMEIPEHGSPLKPMGSRPPPLFRRSSFPVGPSELTYGYQHDSRRTSIESRRRGIIDSRRSSVVDLRPASRPGQLAIGGRSISFDESPERRHRSRLVYRH